MKKILLALPVLLMAITGQVHANSHCPDYRDEIIQLVKKSDQLPISMFDIQVAATTMLASAERNIGDTVSDCIRFRTTLSITESLIERGRKIAEAEKANKPNKADKACGIEVNEDILKDVSPFSEDRIAPSFGTGALPY